MSIIELPQHEMEGHIVTVETTTEEVYRGNLIDMYIDKTKNTEPKCSYIYLLLISVWNIVSLS